MFLYINFEKEHRPTVLFNAKSKSTRYAKKINKSIESFCQYNSKVPDTGVTLYIYKHFSGFHDRA